MKTNINTSIPQYISEKEEIMFCACGFNDEVKLVKDHLLHISDLYNDAGNIAFINNLQGKHAENLRRCLKAWRDNKPWRNTPEFEALIEL